jgi:hypothetical protein
MGAILARHRACYKVRDTDAMIPSNGGSCASEGINICGWQDFSSILDWMQDDIRIRTLGLQAHAI